MYDGLGGEVGYDTFPLLPIRQHHHRHTPVAVADQENKGVFWEMVMNDKADNERLRNQLQVMVNRAAKIPFRFLKDKKLEHFKHTTIADFFEAYEDAREALEQGGQ